MTTYEENNFNWIVFFPDDEHLLTTQDDQPLRLWSIDFLLGEPQPLTNDTLRQKDEPLRFNHDSSLILRYNYYSINVYETDTWKLRFSIQRIKDYAIVDARLLSKTNELWVLYPYKVHVHDLTTGEFKREILPISGSADFFHIGFAISPDESKVIMYNTLFPRDSIQCIDIATMREEWRIGSWSFYRDMQFSPDGNRILVRHNGTEFSPVNDAVQELSTATGEVINTIYTAEIENVGSARYNRDGSLILILPLYKEGNIEIANVATSQSYKIAKYVFPSASQSFAIHGEFSSDSRYIAVAGYLGFGLCEVPEISAVAGSDVELTNALFPATPNPSHGLVTIRFQVAERSGVRLALYNALGVEIAVLEEGVYEPGKHQLWYQSDELPAGQYYIVMRVGAEMRYQPLQVFHQTL
ncbi:MAG: hypothetical protein AB7H80_00080 [Candidatus Kapaibacterium sp.]